MHHAQVNLIEYLFANRGPFLLDQSHYKPVGKYTIVVLGERMGVEGINVEVEHRALWCSLASWSIRGRDVPRVAE